MLLTNFCWSYPIPALSCYLVVAPKILNFVRDSLLHLRGAFNKTVTALLQSSPRRCLAMWVCIQLSICPHECNAAGCSDSLCSLTLLIPSLHKTNTTDRCWHTSKFKTFQCAKKCLWSFATFKKQFKKKNQWKKKKKRRLISSKSWQIVNSGKLHSGTVYNLLYYFSPTDGYK